MTGRQLAAALVEAVAEACRSPPRARRHRRDPRQCDGCGRIRRDIVFLLNRVVLCVGCRQEEHELWCLQDQEDEAREMVMDDLAALNGPGIDDVLNPPGGP